MTSNVIKSTTPGFAKPPVTFNSTFMSFHCPTPKSTGIFAYIIIVSTINGSIGSGL